MGAISKPRPVKLFCGLIFAEKAGYASFRRLLERYFGPTDLESPQIPFSFTDYYKSEMGPGLTRQFIFFRKLISADQLSRAKRITNSIEQKFAKKSGRTVNIDPGYINQAKLVLASTKDFSHRLYLGDGIFGELTLYYKEKAFRSLEWTYPDYKAPEQLALFEKARNIYASQI